MACTNHGISIQCNFKTGCNETKPPIQSSDSSTDDLSGSEDSSSDDLDVEKESKDKEESNMPMDGGNGTEDDDDDLADDAKPKPKQASHNQACQLLGLGAV